jgi:phosphotransferase system IIA component
MVLSWWGGSFQVKNTKKVSASGAKRRRALHKLRYVARLEQLEDRIVPSGNTKALLHIMPNVSNNSATTTTLSLSNAAPVYGTAVTLTATVAPGTGTQVPTQGGVTFFINGGTTLGAGTFADSDAAHDALFTYVTAATQLQVDAGRAQLITATYAGGSGFAGSSSTNNPAVTVAPATLTVTGVTAKDAVYDATTVATLSTTGAALVGVLSGDDVTLNSTAATAAFANKDVGAGIAVSVSGLMLVGSQAANYTLTQPATAANITPAPLTVTGITAADKMYDGSKTVVLNTAGAALAGVFSGDAVTVSTTGAAGIFASKDAGAGIPVTVTVLGLTIGGAQAGDYSLVQPTTTANITRAPLTVTGITAGDKVYDATTKATLNTSGAALVGVLGGDTVTLILAGAAGTFASKDTGTATTVAVSGLTLGGADALDYALVQPTTTANITPATLTVTGVTAANKTYDTSVQATFNTSGASLAGVYSGDAVTLSTTGATAHFATKDAGVGIRVTASGLTLGGAQAGDYTLEQPSATATINPATLTVTGITAANKVYDATTKTTVTVTNAALVGVLNSDAVTLNTSGAAGVFASKDVGTGLTVSVSGLTLSGAQAGDYTLAQPTTTADISPATLTVTGFTVGNKVYDTTTKAPLNSISASLGGLFGGDTVTLSAASAVGTFASKDVGEGIPVAIAGLTLAGAQAPDYTVSSTVTTTANITPAPLTVTGVTAGDKVYDATTTAKINVSGAAIAGVLPGDTVTLNTTGATGMFAAKDVGTGITVTVAGLTLTGAQASDYAVTRPTTTANVTPAVLAVTHITAANKQYDANIKATLDVSGASLAGAYSGDTITLNAASATGTFTSKDVGNAIPVKVSGLTLGGSQAGDYTLVQPTTAGNITPAPLTVTGITAKDKVYDATTKATLNTSAAALVGVFAGDTVNLTTAGATGTFASKDVANGIIVAVLGLTISGPQAGDYTLTQPTTTANITPATLNVTGNSGVAGITASDKVYDATTKATLNTANAVLQGVLNGDTVTLNAAGAVGTFASKDVANGITVMVSGLTLGGPQASDYTLVQPTTTANITPATLTVTGITAKDKVYDATTKATLNTGSAALVGVFAGDTVNLSTAGATGTFASKDVANGITVTVSGLTISGPQAGDYTLAQPTTAANITPATLNVTGNSGVTGITASDKVYDATTKATLNTTNAVLQGVLNGDTVTLNTGGVVGTFASKDVGAGITVAISGLTLGGPQASDYSLVQPTTTANITPATLTVTGIAAKDKVYDATTKATLNTSTAALVGVFAGDTVNLDMTGVTGTFASKDVANGITVAVSGLTISGPQAGDYTLTQPTTTANITPASLNVTGNSGVTGITASDKVYDATTKATLNTTNAVLQGVLSGDTVTLNTAGAVGTFASKDVGAGITVAISGLTLGGPQASDYSLVQPTTTANITPATLTVTGITAKDKVYDATTKATLNTSAAALVGVFAGDTVNLNMTSAAGTFASKDVANGITVAVSGLTISGPQASDYTLTQPTTTANITPATLNVTGNSGVTGITASDKVYDATTKATLNTTNAILQGVLNGDTVTLNTASAVGTFASKDVANGITVMVSGLTLGGPQAGDYSLVQPTTTANITPATLTVTGISAKDKVYDATTKATLDTSTAALVGVFAGDTVNLSTAGATGTFANKDVANGITVTVSGLTISGPQAGDYTLTQPTTTANITPATLNVTGNSGVTGITASDKVYDATTKATLNTTNAALQGVLNGDTVTLNTTGAVGTFASKDVANGITVMVSGLTLGGPQASDYSLVQPTTTANITPATLTVTGITAKDKVYDATTKATLNTSTAALVGVFAGDTVNLSTAGATGTFASKDVANGITVTVSGLTISGPQAGDYTLTQPTTTANITPATLNVTGNSGVTGITASDKVYDATTKATLNTTNAVLQGVLNGDTVTLNTAGAAGTFASKDVANGITVMVSGLTLGGPQASDYTLVQPTTTANITPAALTVTGITAKDKVYDATTKATLNTSTAALVGVFAGDTVNLSTAGATGTFASKDVGNGITVAVSGLTISGPQAGDYTLTQPTTAANITPATLNVTGNSGVTGVTASDKVYDATTKATLNTSNAVLQGVLSGDTVTLNTAGAVGTFASKDVANGITVMVSGLTLGGPQAGDYSLVQPTTTANITPAALTVTGITAKDKVYDTTTKATLNTASATLVGVFAGDTVSLSAAGAIGTFASKDVANGITVTVSGLTLGGPQAGDYTLAQPNTTANITPAILTGSTGVTGITASDKMYDATTKATLNTSGATLLGVLSGDTVTLNTSGAIGTFASKDVGTGITVAISGLTLGGPQASDYSLVQPTATANITPAALTVTGITANDKVYDATTKATLDTSGAALVGVFAGDIVTLSTTGAIGTFASKDVGTGITVAVSGLTLSGPQTSDYTLAQPTTTANITPATLTGNTGVTGITANDKVYDATTKATLNTTNAMLLGVFSGDTVTLNTTGATGTFASKDVGTAITVTVAGLTLDGPQAGNYSLAQPTTTANITPATLTVMGVKANDKVYDATTNATLNTADATLAGVFSGDSVTVSTAGGTGAFASSAVGNNIPVMVTNLALAGPQAGDYTLTKAPATTANITPDLTINPLFAKVGVAAAISSVFLKVDSASSPDTVVYTLLSKPATGTLQDGTTTLAANSTFTQADINGGKLTYTGTQVGSDSFQFSATDGRGGTVPQTAFNITVGLNTPMPRVFVNPQSNLEGLSGLTAFVFQVKLLYGGSTYGPLTYDIYTTDGTAKAGVNYVGITAGDTQHGGTVTFAEGSNYTTVTVYVIAGSLPVTPEFPSATFTINVSDPSNPGVPLDSETATIIAQTAMPFLQIAAPQATGGARTVTPGGTTLTSVDQLTPIIKAAEARWAQAGYPASYFQGIRFQITNFGDHILGYADVHDKVISIDAGADGQGWFVDPAPMTDYAFQFKANSTDLQAVPGGYATSHMDLLTVVEHELGHFLGSRDVTSGPDSLMTQDLEAGMRRLPPGAPAFVWVNPPISQASQLWLPNGNETLVPQTHDDTAARDQVFAEPWSNKPANAGADSLDRIFTVPGSDQN